MKVTQGNIIVHLAFFHDTNIQKREDKKLISEVCGLYNL